jgi:hypothetical protein
MRRSALLLLGALAGCNEPAGDGWRSDVDASLGAQETADASEESAPVVEITVPSCPTSLPLPAGTDPSAMLDIRISGPCGRYCAFAPTIACDEAGVSWSTSTVCSCDADAWDCVSYYPMQATCCGASTYQCPDETAPVAFPEDGGDDQVLPHGDCNCGNGCILRTRQHCSDGGSGITTKYACSCTARPGEGGLWQCTSEWATTGGCGGSAAAGDAADGGIAASDAGIFWIHVAGDGPSYDMTDQVVFTNACGRGGLAGCFASQTAPCLTTGVMQEIRGHTWTGTATTGRLLRRPSSRRPGRLPSAERAPMGRSS